MSHWHVYYASAGCLPDNDPVTIETYEEALEYALGELENVAESLAETWLEEKVNAWLEEKQIELREYDFVELDTHEHDLYHIEVVECFEEECEAPEEV